MKYHLTLPKGAITLRNYIYQGSQTHMRWFPENPLKQGGWKDGDILTVICSFNLNPDIYPLPNSTEYVGLSAGACNSEDAAAVQALINEAKSLPFGSKGSLLGYNSKYRSFSH